MRIEVRTMLCWVAGALVAMPALAASTRYPITTDRVAAAMSSTGMPILPEQVTLLADVVASTRAPELRVRSMEPSGDHRMMVRLECASTEECMPFFVAIRLGQATDTATQVADADRGVPAVPVALPVRQDRSLVLRKGSPAILFLDSTHVHIRIPVVCLDNGAPGQTIRVKAGDHGQVYAAQVVDSSTLKGRL